MFYFIEPTNTNLSMYERWQRLSSQSETFLGDMVDKCYRLVAKEGQTVLIPTGWIHAVLTTKDSLVFGGNFLHSLNIQLQLKVFEIEERVRTPKKFKFPSFEAVNWLAAQKLKNDLGDLNSDSTLCPSHLLSGIKALSQTLRSWLPALAEKPCPPSIDPHKLVRELGRELRLAEKVTLKYNPPKPARESTRKKQKRGLDEDFIDISRGNAFLFLGGRVSKKKPAASADKKDSKVTKDSKEPNKKTAKQEAKIKSPPVKTTKGKKASNTPVKSKQEKAPASPSKSAKKTSPAKAKVKTKTKKSPPAKVTKSKAKTKAGKKKDNAPPAIKIVPKKRKILDDNDVENSSKPLKKRKKAAVDVPALKVKPLAEPPPLKLKLPTRPVPMSSINPVQAYDLTNRDAVRQLLNTHKQTMKQLDSELGDALAGFGGEEEDEEEVEDLVIDENPIRRQKFVIPDDPEDVPIKLKLLLGGRRPSPSPPKNKKKQPLKAVIKQRPRSKAMEDMNMTKVHQDDEYIYPSLELSDDEMDVGPNVDATAGKDDTAWTPKVRVGRPGLKVDRSNRERNSKKVAAVE